MIENVILEIGYADCFLVDVEYEIDAEKHLQTEIKSVFGRRLNRNIEHIPHRHRMPNGFAILSYKSSCVFSPDYSWIEYELYYGDKAKGNRMLSRQEAMAMIDILGLDLVVDSEDGKVWE